MKELFLKELFFVQTYEASLPLRIKLRNAGFDPNKTIVVRRDDKRAGYVYMQEDE